MRVLVLGGTGMLGSMMAKVLPDEWEVLVTARTTAPYPYELVNRRWKRFEIGPMAWIADLQELSKGCDWIVNCLGATKPLMAEDAAGTCNEHLPRELVSLGPPVIHASTDCVFLGKGGGPYDEYYMPNATDQYGWAKTAGEPLGKAIVLRCSIVGPECRFPARYLLGRVIEGRVNQGFTDHFWNGLTTLAWARLAMAIMEHPEGVPPAWLLHLVPSGSCSKDRLVSIILQAHGLLRQVVDADPSGDLADMRLSTIYRKELRLLWKLAGYDVAPTIEEMVHEQASYCRQEQWPPSGVEGWRYWRRP